MSGKVVLITGASSGIGKACAEYLAQKGYRVFGTSRSAPRNPEVSPTGLTMFYMDVNDDRSVQEGVDFVLRQAGRLDAVVNNAGFGIAGSVEDTSIEEAKAQLETNFFGTLRVCRAALPVMRAQGGGTIVNISSLGGIIALPFQGLYSASKFAVEGLTEALRMEAQPFGIRVVLVEPGDTRTGFTDRRVRVAASANSVYRPYFERVIQVVEADERNGTHPEAVARVVERILRHPNPAPRYRVGPFVQRLAAALKGVLPDRLFLWAISKYYRL
ncbi:MAG: SDR family oxidoreductase [Anaerolineae bacterium]|nr:SDR family oxidoreductase [Anaerolineae bacterium]MCX8067081.1 SDR family oxidoreductase [Anaerolineae bacterium]MDW7990710.1 SDR family oxidoreductase [Anaerolineae bacterium]